jgi:hypothetical protein
VLANLKQAYAARKVQGTHMYLRDAIFVYAGCYELCDLSTLYHQPHSVNNIKEILFAFGLGF